MHRAVGHGRVALGDGGGVRRGGSEGQGAGALLGGDDGGRGSSDNGNDGGRTHFERFGLLFFCV